MTNSAEGPGLFIAFEGGDGAGKSTQSRLLAEALRSRGITVVQTREPGGTEIGEKLRSLVLDHGQGEIDARTEALMYAAARAAHVEQLIRPALARGEAVITDRYIDSSIAYQGIGRGLGIGEIRDLNVWATNALWPHFTVILDVDPAAGRARRAPGGEDRLESEPDSFHAQVRQAFLDTAATAPERHLVIDGLQDVDTIAALILARVDEVLSEHAGSPSPGMDA
ncbi:MULTISPECIES: dTMP kinase [Arthrobacter]|uniref:Thymidylate kinase n=2 Tax=Arthrobacter TaxID=1663 RepID=A0ABU9KHD1_9MICC|nr:dTMP kinase [Arthrobacter sp. YJM1]MDP5226680.1 dTMP kinase [Arthrobacter sp. YJM1]